MASPQNVTLEDLLAQAGWVQALARSLVRDPEDASDIAQDAWVSALTKPPSHGRNLRAWFARVLRRRRADARRTEARREAREERAPRGAAVPSAEDLLCRAECRARIAQEVLRLEEPYRGTILLRYVEDVPAVEIARLHCVPDATVRTRLRRALGDLRARLGAAHGDIRLVVAPLLGGWPDWTTQLGSEVLVAASKTKLVVVSCTALALASGAAWLVVDAQTRPGSDAPTSESLAARDTQTEGPSLAGAARVPSAEIADAALAQEGVRWEWHERDRVAAGVVAGVVTDELGRPRAGVAAILWEQGDETRQRIVATDAAGRFSFEGVADGSHTLWLRWGRAELRRGVRAGAASLEVSLLHDDPFPAGVSVARAAPKGVLGGTVVDRQGGPVAGCEVRLGDGSGTPFQTTTTDAAGDFRFVSLAGGPFGLSFHALATPGVFTYARPGQWLSVTLKTPLRIAGVVVEAGTEQPLVDVPVAVFPPAGVAAAATPPPVRTGPDGSFALVVGEGAWRVGVGLPAGFVAASRAAAEFRYQEIEAEAGASLRIALVRGAVIEGELRGPDGAPWVGGAVVYAYPLHPDGTVDVRSGHRGVLAGADGTFRIIGLAEAMHDISVTRSETTAAETPTVFGLERRVAVGTRQLLVHLRYARTVVVGLADPVGERLLIKGGWVQARPSGTEPGGPGAVDAHQREDGLFESAPVDPAQTYVVKAGGFAGYTEAESAPVRAGDPDIVVRFDGAALSGRVITHMGDPVPKAQVQAWAIGLDRPLHAAAETDADGRFLIPGAPRGPVKVVVLTNGRSQELGEFKTPASNLELRLLPAPQ